MANDRNWGGKRKGAGRKPRPWKTVPHRKRPFAYEDPLRLALLVREEIPLSRVVTAVRRELRRWNRERQETESSYKLHEVVIAGRQIRLAVYTSLHNVPGIMQRFALRIARRVNKVLHRIGKVFRERYRVLTPPKVAPPPPTWKERLRHVAEDVGIVLMHGIGMTAGTGISRRHQW